MLEIPHPNWEQRLAKVPGESREGMIKWLEAHPSGLTPADKLFYKDFRQPFMEASDVINNYVKM
jgi:putative heme iron utilization protein